MRRRAIQIEREDIWTGLKPDEMRSLPPGCELVVVNASDFELESFSLEQLDRRFRWFTFMNIWATDTTDGFQIDVDEWRPIKTLDGKTLHRTLFCSNFC